MRRIEVTPMSLLRRLTGRPVRQSKPQVGVDRAVRKRAAAIDLCLDAEREATDAGIAAFAASRARPVRSVPLLRRNVHRLEKGLSMPDRRAVFAEKYITETVEVFARLAASAEAEPGELRWARDVLTQYFEVVTPVPGPVADALAAFRAIPADPAGVGASVPYPERDLAPRVAQFGAPLPDATSFHALCTARRSQRWFADRPVAPEVLETAMAAALQAPSACNRQPFTFHAAVRRDLIRQIAALPLGTEGFGDDLPVLVAVIGNLGNYAEPRDRHLIFIDSGLAAMQFMLSITAQGLGSVPINWPDIPDNHAALRGLLGLAAHEVPVMLIGVGHPHPDRMIPFSAKRPVADMLRVHG
jgi:nitroreductase